MTKKKEAKGKKAADEPPSNEPSPNDNKPKPEPTPQPEPTQQKSSTNTPTTTPTSKTTGEARKKPRRHTSSKPKTRSFINGIAWD